MDTKAMNEYLDQWLRDAHAMEEQAETMLKSQHGRIENYPQLSQKIEQHIRETASQRERLEACLTRRGTSASGAKDLAGKFTAMMQGLSGTVMGDEVTKGAMASYTFEHFEISAYRELSAAAERCGDTETKQVVEDILKEEQAMADWLYDELPRVAGQFLERAGSPDPPPRGSPASGTPHARA
jgi:ferritin-like metal-binding protein YciE